MLDIYGTLGPRCSDRATLAAMFAAGMSGVRLNLSHVTLRHAEKQIAKAEEMGFGSAPVCIAKTQYSFSDDPAKLGAPEGFTVSVKNVKVSAGAGFVVVLTGDIMTMPGLPKSPAAERIDVDENGTISGLF